MCRYAFKNYDSHWVCLPDRVSFKHPHCCGEQPRCPHCGEDMIDMGMDFKAPRKRAEKQWRKLEILVENDVRFNSCGCVGPGKRPGTLSEAKSEFNLRRKANKHYSS